VSSPDGIRLPVHAAQRIAFKLLKTDWQRNFKHLSTKNTSAGTGFHIPYICNA
jgi:hypothetical protein